MVQAGHGVNRAQSTQSLKPLGKSRAAGSRQLRRPVKASD